MAKQEELFDGEAAVGEVAHREAAAVATVESPVATLESPPAQIHQPKSTSPAEVHSPAKVQVEAARAVVNAFKGWSTSTPTGSVFGHGTGNESPFGGPPPPYLWSQQTPYHGATP